MPAKAKFTKQVITMVEPELRAQLDEYATENNLSLSDVVRRAVIAGLPLLETPAKSKPVFERTTRPAAYATFGFGQAEFTD